MMLSVITKKNYIKKIVKLMFSGFSILFIGILFFIVVHDSLTGTSSTTAEYCTKYSYLISPGCW